MTEQRHSYPLVSYHGGHTAYDGAGDPEEFIEAAISLGFKAFGFSEHMPIEAWNTYGDTSFAFSAASLQRFDEYVERVTSLQAAYRADLPVLLGVAMLEGSGTDCICFVVDIARQKQTEQQLIAANQSADAANQAKSQFLANMSH